MDCNLVFSVNLTSKQIFACAHYVKRISTQNLTKVYPQGLKQKDGICFVTIYDENGFTPTPDGLNNSVRLFAAVKVLKFMQDKLAICPA